jgi:peptidyl-prolyl cis-trans isomerase C
MTRFLIVFLLLPVVSGCVSAKSDDSKVLARFDGTTVTENELKEKMGGLPRAMRSLAVDRKKELVEDIAAEHFLLKEARRQGLDKDPDVQRTVAAAEKKILIARLIEKEVDEKMSVDPQDVAKYYELNRPEFMTPELLRASHILVESEEEAKAIRSALDGGADFEETARQRSKDATAIRGGDLGFFQKGQFVPEFEQAVFALSKGQVSAPVRTQFGWHIIRLNDRMEPRLRELKAVKGLVEERLVQEKRVKAFRGLIAALQGNTKIEIDQAALSAVEFKDPEGGA